MARKMWMRWHNIYEINIAARVWTGKKWGIDCVTQLYTVCFNVSQFCGELRARVFHTRNSLLHVWCCRLSLMRTGTTTSIWWATKWWTRPSRRWKRCTTCNCRPEIRIAHRRPSLRWPIVCWIGSLSWWQTPSTAVSIPSPKVGREPVAQISIRIHVYFRHSGAAICKAKWRSIYAGFHKQILELS